ncbi:MAG: hypothetical protein SFW64_03140 [Alphaproteobacteria bacterium]|nr:hypothetical protein [Alphaproteobacteria bacterium]
MASDNNPETHTTANEAVSTKVHAGGKEYELKGIDTAAGLELYHALPAASQTRAQQTATIITTFASVQKIAADHGMDATELARNWLTSVSETAAAKEAQQHFTDAQKQAVSELGKLGADAREFAHMVPGGNTILGFVDTARGAATVAGAVTSAIGATADGVWNGAPRTWNLLSTMGSEAFGKLFGYGAGAPSDSALVFGAAMEALHNEAAGARHAMPMFDWNPLDNVDSQIGSNPLQYGSAALGWAGEWLAQHLPGIAKYVIGAYEWLTYKGENKPEFSAFVAKAEQEILESARTRPANVARFHELADEAMWDRETQTVKAAMLAAKEVAGIPTEGAVDAAAADNVTARGTDGVDRQYKNGKIVSETTPGQRTDDAWHAVTGDGHPAIQALRVAGAGVGVGAAVWQPLRGLAEGVAASHITRPEAEAKKLAEKANTALDKVTAPNAERVKPWQLWRKTPEQLAALKTQYETLNAETAAAKATAESRLANAGAFTRTASAELKGANIFEKLWNVPRHVGRWFGDHGTNAVVATGELGVDAAKVAAHTTVGAVVGGKDVGVGVIKGVHSVVNDVELSQAATRAEAAGRFGGRLATKALNAFAPVYSAGETLRDIGRGDTAGAIVHGTQTTAIVGTMTAFKVAKIGVGRATPVVGVLISGGEFVNATAHGDTKGMKSAGIDLGIIGSFAAAGVGVGLLGGPFAPVTSTAGAAVGATVGGFVVAGRAIYNMFSDDSTPQQPVEALAPNTSRTAAAQPAQQSAAMTPEELAAAHAGEREQVRLARMSTAAGRTGENRELAKLNLGMRVKDVYVGTPVDSTPLTRNGNEAGAAAAFLG